MQKHAPLRLSLWKGNNPIQARLPGLNKVEPGLILCKEDVKKENFEGRGSEKKEKSRGEGW